MARNTSDNPLYQVFRQWHGCRHHELMGNFHSNRAVKIFLDDMKRHEGMRGKECLDNDVCGGFTAYVGTVDDMSPRTHYWWQVVMTDEAINSESTPIYQDILDKCAEAMLIGAVEGKARREAAAAGINYEPGDDA